jgi:hypothetical protein
MAVYLSLLEEATGSSLAARGTFTRQKQLSDLTARRVRIIEENRKVITVGGKQVPVETTLTTIVNNVSVAKDLISTVALAEPHAALACAGLVLATTV